MNARTGIRQHAREVIVVALFVVALVTGLGANAFLTGQPALFDGYGYGGDSCLPILPQTVGGEFADESVTVTWAAPADDSSVTGYVVYVRTGGVLVTTAIVDENTFTAAIDGLTNGTTYAITVAVITAAGQGCESAPIIGSPCGPPGSPAITDVAAGDHVVTVTWVAPVDDGGSPLISYTVDVTEPPGVPVVPPQTVGAGVFTATFTGLVNGHTYSFAVSATNACADGPPSPPASGTPVGQPGPGGGGGPTDNVIRLGGLDRVMTAIVVSQDSFADDGATSAVLTRSDAFPDALTATPLALKRNAPLLLTGSATLETHTEAELSRVLPAGATVYLVGGTTALSPAIATRLTDLGYVVVRYAGITRYETAVAVADQGLGNPANQFLTTGLAFPDALSGGAVAGVLDVAILLTNGTQPHPATVAYLSTHPAAQRWCIGGPACTAHPGTTALAGADRYETSIIVARQFFPSPTAAGVATGEKFPDALSGGAHIGRRHGPMLLTPTASLYGSTQQYLEEKDPSISVVYIYGGTEAIAPNVQAAIEAIIN